MQTKAVNLVKRYLMLCMGLAVMAFGVAFSIKAGLGTSPISSLPYVLSRLIPFTVGTTTIIMNTLFVLIQIAILRRRYQPYQLLQLPAAILFGTAIDVAGFVLQGLVPAAYWQQWLICLLGIFLAEKSFVGPGNIHELRDDRRHAAEVDGPLGAAQLMGNVAVYADVGAVSFRIHFGRFGMEHGVDADAFQLAAVFFKAARIGVEILVRPELGRVDKDRGDDDVALFLRRPHEGQVAFMQGSHRRDQADAFSFFF